MNLFRSHAVCLVLAASTLIFVAPAAQALPKPPLSKRQPKATIGVDIQEKLGAKIPSDLTFTNAEGQQVQLGRYLNRGVPVVLTLAYYRCPMLCDLVLRGISDTMKRVKWTPGKDFQAITVSIDPADTRGAAQTKKLNVLRAMSHAQSEEGWAFLIDPAKKNVAKLADSVGFQYQYDEQSEQYAHPAVVMVLTPDGRISRYLYGVAYRPLDVKLALVEASQGKVGGIVERVLLTCFRYDPATRKYGFVVNAVLKGGAGFVLLSLFGVMVQLWRHDSQRQRNFRRALASANDANPNNRQDERGL